MTTFDERPPMIRPEAAHALLGKLTELGYVGRFAVEADGLLCCGVCGTCLSAHEASLDGRRWIHDDHEQRAQVVIAVRCRACGSRGALALDLHGSGGEEMLAHSLGGTAGADLPFGHMPPRSRPNATERPARRAWGR